MFSGGNGMHSELVLQLHNFHQVKLTCVMARGTLDQQASISWCSVPVLCVDFRDLLQGSDAPRSWEHDNKRKVEENKKESRKAVGVKWQNRGTQSHDLQANFHKKTKHPTDFWMRRLLRMDQLWNWYLVPGCSTRL